MSSSGSPTTHLNRAWSRLCGKKLRSRHNINASVRDAASGTAWHRRRLAISCKPCIVRLKARLPPVHDFPLFLPHHHKVSAMKRSSPISKSSGLCMAALIGVAGCFHAFCASVQSSPKGAAEQPITLEQRAQVTYDAYILGPGDGLQIELFDMPELSGSFYIGPDGTLCLPRLRALYVEGLTVEELRIFLTQQFKTYVRDPQVYVRPVAYRPIRVYVGGEVKRPGYYTLSGESKLSNLSESAERRQLETGTATDLTRPGLGQLPGGASGGSGGSGLSTFGAVFPTVFDAIRSANGITPYTDLSKVQVVRKRAEGLGGGRIKTNLNFLSLITEGNESQNIRLFDGDTLNISKSPIVLRDQLLKAGQSNLSRSSWKYL